MSTRIYCEHGRDEFECHECRQTPSSMDTLRTELERLVTEWRDGAYTIASHFGPAAYKMRLRCADDLEAVLRRTAEEDGEYEE